MIIRTKGALLKKFRTVKINYCYNLLKLSFITNFSFVPYRNKLLSLVRYAHGDLSYYITTEKHKMFNMFFVPWKHERTHYNHKKFFGRLIFYKNLSFVSLVETMPLKGAQYCRSSGTISKILKLDYKSLSTLIKLPSGRTKFFSAFGFAASARVLFKDNKKFFNSKAGYWKGFGFKSIVRGVAMNPVDHPHGGRTKSIKYPKTPWGKTTKFK